MAETVARSLVLALEIYFGAGLLFAIAFVARGAGVIDPGAQHAKLGFRLLILPGSALLWPYLLRRWLGRSPPPTERNAHRNSAESHRSGP